MLRLDPVSEACDGAVEAVTFEPPESVTTDILRDPFGKPESITRSGPYGGGNVSVTRGYVYDSYQRLCKTIEPESGTTIVAYTADDLVDWSADGQTSSGTNQASCILDRGAILASEKISRTHDSRHRELTRKISGADFITSTYFGDGQINTLTAANPGNAPVTTTYSYNNRRLLTQEVLSINAGAAVWTFAYAYNANGHLSSQTYPGNLLVGYAPDGLGRPTQVGTFATGVTYHPNGAIAGFTYGNGIVHTMTQNARQLPARSLDSYGSGGNATKVLDDTFSYDGNGNVLSLTDASNAPTAENRSWGVMASTLYDGLDRLTSVRSTNQWGTPTGNYNAVYTYDPLDNLRSNRLGAAQLAYGYNSSNRLSTLSYNGGAAQAVSSDLRGNITANAYRNQAYQFDLAHRMNAVTGQESYLYDGHGRRARTLNLQTGTIEYFGYGKDGRLLQDWSNRRQVRNGYIYLGNTLVGLYEVNLTNGTITPKYQHTDALGSPVVTTDAGKTVLSRMSYTPYGQPTLPMDGVGYTGHFVDVGTQLTYMQQRYYDPTIGRFLSTDPAESEFNQYNYASNNPYSFVDLDGRKASPSTDPDDPMNDPNRPNGCGTTRHCTRDSDGEWHNGVQAVSDWVSSAADSAAESAADFAASHPLPQGVVDAANGFGTGVVNGASFGFADGGYFFDQADSAEFSSFKTGGTVVGAVASGGALAKTGGAALKRVAGPGQQWLRFGPSYSHALGARIQLSLRWGASPTRNGKYLKQIPLLRMRALNQWLRSLKLPGSNWRVADPGHLHLVK